MRLRYKAISQDGKRIRGFVEASEEKDAASYLRQKNLIPIEVSKENKIDILRKTPFGGRV